MNDQEFQDKVDSLEESDPELYDSYQKNIRDYGLEKAKQFYLDIEVNEMDFFEALDRIQGETELEKYGDGDEDVDSETELSAEPEDDKPKAKPSEKPPVDIMSQVEKELEGL